MKTLCSCGKVIEKGTKCPYCSDRKKIEVKTKKPYHPFQSREGRKIRDKVLAKQGYCERCYSLKGEKNIFKLEVHHVKPWSKFPELAYDLDNLDVLCADCNKKIGNTGKIDYKRIDKKFDDEFNI